MLRLPDYTPNVVAEWILAIVKTFESINPSEIRATLNVEREVSGFPEITELSDIDIRNPEVQTLLSTSYQVCLWRIFLTAKERLSVSYYSFVDR